MDGDFSRRFGSVEAHRDLKGKTIRGGAITFSSQIARFFLYTLSSIVLGRLLSPQDYGLVGMVTAITGFLRVFNYAGLSTATVQRSVVTHGLISTVFWINIALGVVMTLLSTVLAPALVWFYHEPRLYWITIAMSSTFLLDAAGAQHLALLRRQMRFRVLAIIDVTSMVFGVVVSVAAALAGLGFWSLVIFQTLTGVVPLVGSWMVEPWRPGLPQRNSGAGSMLRFGGFLTAVTALNYLFRNIDNVLIGWRWGAGPLGFYQKAYSLLMLPITQVNTPITSVAVASLSRLNSEAERSRRYFVGGYSVATAITIPVVITATIFAGDIIPFLLGRQWLESVSLFQLLAPAALVGALISPLDWLFVSTGQTDRQFKMALVWTSLILVAFGAGLKYGAQGVAVGFSAMSLLLAIPACLYAIQGTHIRFGDIFQALKFPAIAISLPGLLGVFFRLHALNWAPLGLRAIGGCSLVLLLYAFMLLVVLRQWNTYRDLVSHLIPRRRAS